MTVQDRARAAERRANLLAGLNDAPSALTGWPGVLEEAYELGRPGRSVRMHPRRGPGLRRRLRLARAWAPYQRQRTEAAFQGMRDSLRAVGEAVGKIMDAFSHVVVPRLPEAGELTQDDLVRGA